MVVVHYADVLATRRCLESLRADASGVARKISVVDNSAGGEGALEADGLGPDVVLVPSPDNPGFGEGANRGVARLEAEGTPAGWVILNHDVEVLPGFLEATRAALTRPAERIGAVGGPVFLDHEAGRLWSAGGDFRRLSGTVRQMRPGQDVSRPRDVGFLPAAALAVAPEAWAEIGGFDPEFFLYNEDLDLCLRLRRAGWRLRFEPAMAAVHHLGAATGSRQRSPLYLHHLSRTRFRPFPSRPYRLYLAALHTPYVLLRALWYLVRDRSRERARSLVSGHLSALRRIW